MLLNIYIIHVIPGMAIIIFFNMLINNIVLLAAVPGVPVVDNCNIYSIMAYNTMKYILQYRDRYLPYSSTVLE